MTERDVLESDVLLALLVGERIEDYPDDFPYPSALFHASVRGRLLHVVAAFDIEQNREIVITVYEPDPVHFEAEYRTRRRQ